MVSIIRMVLAMATSILRYWLRASVVGCFSRGVGQLVPVLTLRGCGSGLCSVVMGCGGSRIGGSRSICRDRWDCITRRRCRQGFVRV